MPLGCKLHEASFVNESEEALGRVRDSFQSDYSVWVMVFKVVEVSPRQGAE